jgi:hypothetical protein
MKKITLFALMLITSITFAQVVPSVKIANYVQKQTKTFPSSWNSSNSPKTTIDTIGWTAGSIPQFGSPTAEVHVYTMTDASSNPVGYWFGVNGDSTDYWAQGYSVAAPVKISGILALIGGKYNGSSSAASVMEASIYNIAADNAIIDASSTKGPGPDVYGQVALGTATKTITNLDTNWFALNYFAMPSLVSVAADFAIVTNFKTIREHGDTAYMMCDAIGNGLGLNYAFYNSDPQKYYWMAASVSTLDVNMSLFAVIDDGAGINDNGFFQGAKMTINQNPCKDNLSISYAVENDAKVVFELLSLTGQVVLKSDEGMRVKGNVYSINSNISDLPAGTYLCSLKNNGNRLIKKVVVE